MVTLAVLAGGESSRMGRDKALLPFQGRPLVFRVLDRLASLADETLLIASPSPGRLALGVCLVPDLFPGQGPLGGLYTALSFASHPIVILAGCDIPFISAALVTHELRLLASENADAVVPSSASGPEPLQAVYRRATCLPLIQAALERGERRVISWFSQANVRVLSAEETKPFDPLGRVFFNLNTPADLSLAERWAEEEIGLGYG